MVELTLLMCAAAWGLRRLYGWRQRRSQGLGIGDYTSRTPAFAKRPERSAGASVTHHTLADSLIRRLSNLDWAVLALFSIASVSLFAASYFEVALREWRIILLEPAIFYALLRSSRLDRAAVWRIVDALVLAGAVVAV